MTREQFLLMKAAEECAEVAQRAIKSMQYGSQQVWKGGEVVAGSAPPKNEGITNAQRLTDELIDLAVMCELLEEIGAIATPPDQLDYDKIKAAKIAKLNKYLDFSRSLGTIDGDWKV